MLNFLHGTSLAFSKLSFPTDLNGNRSMAYRSTLSASRQLYDVFMNAAIYHCLYLTDNWKYHPTFSLNEVYNKNPFSFLKYVRKDWLKILELVTPERLRAEGNTAAYQEYFTVPVEDLILRLDVIKEAIQAWFDIDHIVQESMVNDTIVTFFRISRSQDTSEVGTLIYGWFKMLYHSRHGQPNVTKIEPYGIPNFGLRREGYTIFVHFWFDASDVVFYDGTKFTGENDIFLQHLTTSSGNSDMYLKMAMAQSLPVPIRGFSCVTMGHYLRKVLMPLTSLSELSERLMHDNVLFHDLNVEDIIPTFIEILAKVHQVSPITIGPVCSALFIAIEQTSTPYAKACIDRITGLTQETSKDIEQQKNNGMESFRETILGITDDPFKSTYSKLMTMSIFDPSNILSNPMDRPFDLPELMAISEMEEDIPEIVPEEEPSKEEPTPSEDPVEEPNEPEEIIPPIVVEVPPNSYLLKTKFTSKVSLDTWLFYVQVNNLITHVLENPPEALTVEHKTILRSLQNEYLFCVSVESVRSILKAVFKIVPKSPKSN